MVLIDTVILSYALRRRHEALNLQERLLKANLERLMEIQKAQVIGPVRQELLSGIKDKLQFEAVREAMGAFDNIPLNTLDFEEAARLSNICRRQGIAGAPTDFLICSVALIRKWQIFTNDSDFQLYQRHLPIKLFTPER